MFRAIISLIFRNTRLCLQLWYNAPKKFPAGIRTDLQEVGCGYLDWIGLTQDRDRWRTLVSAVMNLRVP